MNSLQCMPIGRVRVDESKGIYALEIEKKYREGLIAMEEFGRIQVLWWADKMDSEEYRGMLSCELPYAPGTRAGVFACRSEYRPNPVELTSCGVLKVDIKTGEVILDYIDAFDGTAIVDIKPYIPVCDRARNFRVAPWFRSWPQWMEDAAEFFSNEAAPKVQ